MTEIHCGIRDKAKFLDWIRYLAATRGAGFAKIFAQDEVLGKKTVLIKITEVAHAVLSSKRSGNTGSGAHFQTLNKKFLISVICIASPLPSP